MVATPSLYDLSLADPRLDQQEPEKWFVVFHRGTSRRWLRWLAFGKYKHVTAFGYVPAVDGWLFCDYRLNRLVTWVVPDILAQEELCSLEEFADEIQAGGRDDGYRGYNVGFYSSLGTVVEMPAPSDRRRVNWKPGIGCVPAIAHLLGLSSWAVRPDGLFKACLANGGSVISTAQT